MNRSFLRVWLGLALLSVSWLLGLGYYHEADWMSWGFCIVAGVLLVGPLVQNIATAEGWLAVALLAPAMVIAPWPYKIALILMMLGIVGLVAPSSPRGLRWLGSTLLTGGIILLVQGIAMFGYEVGTAQSHDLPAPFPAMMEAVAKVLDVDAGAAGSTLTVGSMRKTQPIAATWELLFDPATFCFIAGAAVALWFAIRRSESARLRKWAAALATVIGVVILWTPLRIGLWLGLMLHRTLQTEYEEPLIVNNQFFNSWLHLILLGGVVLLAWRFVKVPASAAVATEAVEPPPRDCWKPVVAGALIAASIALLSAALFWDPAGSRKPGRILVDEFHSNWEPTSRPMDTEWYGQSSGYNYACIYDYCTRFYDMGRITSTITDDTLKNCDVLMLKDVTSKMEKSEVDSIQRFVERGGGVLLVGEHTDVFGTGRNSNDVARRFDFEFRYDCLFGIDHVFDDPYTPPLVPHPIIQSMGNMEFAVSCSIEPHGAGRAVIRGVGLKNMPADYHASNFYPQVEDRAESRYGAFVQCWSTRYGKGRVVGFCDSTIWSNFCTFEPGKIELLMGLMEWLNHRNGIPDPRPWLTGLGLIALVAGMVAKKRSNAGWLPLLAAGICAWSLTAVTVRAAQHYAMPPPKQQRPMNLVAMDQLTCSVQLPKDGFIAGHPGEFGIFERWILRVGYFTCRRDDASAFNANMVVYCYPDKPVPADYLEQMREYVRNGGHVLVLDSAKNTKSTANELLFPFGMSVKHSFEGIAGTLMSKDLPTVQVTDAIEVTGGEEMSKIGDRVVAARKTFGKGSITAIGFGQRFEDVSMGVTGDIQPDDTMRKIYEVEYQLLRNILEPGRSKTTQPSTTFPTTFATTPATTPPAQEIHP